MAVAQWSSWCHHLGCCHKLVDSCGKSSAAQVRPPLGDAWRCHHVSPRKAIGHALRSRHFLNGTFETPNVYFGPMRLNFRRIWPWSGIFPCYHVMLAPSSDQRVPRRACLADPGAINSFPTCGWTALYPGRKTIAKSSQELSYVWALSIYLSIDLSIYLYISP